jgi:6,7-dimethyl-8-ribityllumazine synthase
MPIRVHVVAGYIHREICESMITYAKSLENELEAVIERVIWVPGNLETPFAVNETIKNAAPDGIIVFGVQASGKTKHGEVIANQVTRKLLDLQLRYRMPMAVAIIGPNASLEYAKTKAQASSLKAMRAVVHMIKLKLDTAQ